MDTCSTSSALHPWLREHQGRKAREMVRAGIMSAAMQSLLEMASKRRLEQGNISGLVNVDRKSFAGSHL